jgi:peptidoglycan hydrolase-like protein with peptidoglycan-binding domain
MTTKLNMVLLLVGTLFTIFILETSLPTTVVDNEAYAGARASRSESQTVYSYNMVRKAQRVLIDLGYNSGPIDGIWGPKTKSAVRQFQSDNELPATGMLDMKTRSKLFSGN